MKRVRLVVFDWDGTLVDSSDHIVESLKYAARLMGWEQFSSDAYKRMIGLSMDRVLSSLYPQRSKAAHEQFRAFYKQHFFDKELDGTKPFEGADGLLENLLQEGKLLAVATGKGLNGLEVALDQTGFRKYFAAYRCAETTASKPDPLMLNELLSELGVSAGDAVMVGDTTYDMDMAANASVAKLAVTYGVHNKTELADRRPDYLVDSLEELAELFGFV